MCEDRVLFQKLHYLLHRSLVDARNLSCANKPACVAELADTFEIIPSLMAHWDDSHLALIRENLSRYQAKHAELGHDYLAVLDMDDEQFASVYASW